MLIKCLSTANVDVTVKKSIDITACRRHFVCARRWGVESEAAKYNYVHVRTLYIVTEHNRAQVCIRVSFLSNTTLSSIVREARFTIRMSYWPFIIMTLILWKWGFKHFLRLINSQTRLRFDLALY